MFVYNWKRDQSRRRRRRWEGPSGSLPNQELPTWVQNTCWSGEAQSQSGQSTWTSLRGLSTTVAAVEARAEVHCGIPSCLKSRLFALVQEQIFSSLLKSPEHSGLIPASAANALFPFARFNLVTLTD